MVGRRKLLLSAMGAAGMALGLLLVPDPLGQSLADPKTLPKKLRVAVAGAHPESGYGGAVRDR